MDIRKLRTKPFSMLMVASLISLTAACGGQATTAGPAEPRAAGASAAVQVRNESTTEMRIYVVAGGQRIRMGNVVGLRTQILEIPDHMVGDGRSLGFQASPIAGQLATTDWEIFVRPGDRIQLTIPSYIR